MNLLPVFSAIAIAATAYLGVDNPGWWKESRYSTKTI